MPPVEPQILLKVRFGNVDRSASQDLGVSFASGAFNQCHGASAPDSSAVRIASHQGTSASPMRCSILLFRKDINLAAAIKALEGKNLLEMLAEPNLLAINGQEASFLAGGEFPFPMVQPQRHRDAITIMFREYGIRI